MCQNALSYIVISHTLSAFKRYFSSNTTSSSFLFYSDLNLLAFYAQYDSFVAVVMTPALIKSM